MKKTNAMRLLDQGEISYDILAYEAEDGAIDGLAVAEKVNRSKEEVFKTLIVQGASKQYYVCMIPVEAHLSLKKVAKASKEKKVEMIAVKDLLSVSGYVRGGCSPIGMKKDFPTFIHEDIEILDRVVFSGGKIGLQIEMQPKDLLKMTNASVVDITEV
ncbi:MAG: Cys-tRNA(Pro) deacylase [Clostridia bacterium]|nr:Cys-tRNA(Pro) deacylase [Clostridia bacterium]